MIKLNPCPFCGESEKVKLLFDEEYDECCVDSDNIDNALCHAYVHCYGCDSTWIKESPYETPRIVQKAWNRRTGGWISVKDRLPEPETEVLIIAKRVWDCGSSDIITTAIYEDGSISTDESDWNWYELDYDYDEENDRYLIPEGWFEYNHYNSDEEFNHQIDDIVTHWMPLPEAPQCEG